MQRQPHQVFIFHNGQQYNELEDLEKELSLKYPDIRVQTINRLSAINPHNVSEHTLILILNKFTTPDPQFSAEVQSLLRNKARSIVYPSPMFHQYGVQHAATRPDIIANVGAWLAPQQSIMNSSLNNTKNLSDLYLSKSSNMVMYHKSKNKNFNALMSSLALKYKDYPIEIKEVRDINDVRKMVGRQIIYIVCNWEAIDLNSLVQILKNDPSQKVHTIMYVTEGVSGTDSVQEYYDFSTSNFNEVQYLIDATLGKTLNSNITSSVSSSQFRNSTNYPAENIQYQPSQSQFKQLSSQVGVLNSNVREAQVPSYPVGNPQSMNGFHPPMNGTAMGMNNGQVAVNSLPISPVRPISSGPMANSEYFPNPNNSMSIPTNARPQSANPQTGQQQLNFHPNVPGVPSPFSGSTFYPGGGGKNSRIQLLSAKKVQRQVTPRRTPLKHNLLVVDSGQNLQFRNFYSPILKNCQVINSLPSSLTFDQPTTILAPYEMRSKLHQYPHNIQNLSFVLYSPELTPDWVVRHNLVDLSTSSPRELQAYLQSKGILTQRIVDSRIDNTNNQLFIASGQSRQLDSHLSRMARVTSTMGENSSRSMEWSTFPTGPGQFMTTMGDNVRQSPLSQAMYQSQTATPITFNYGQNMPPLRGTFDQTTMYPMQQHGNSLDTIFRVIQEDRQRFNQGSLPTPNTLLQNQPEVIHYQPQHNLNQSSQMQEMVINFNKNSQLSAPPALAGGPLIFPSGVQRQSLMRSQNYQVPLVVDESNIKNMNTPLLVMPTVPESRLSNMESQISKRRMDSSYVFNDGVENINYINQRQNETFRGLPQNQTAQLGYTFGASQFPQVPPGLSNMIIETMHPNEVPYPGPNQSTNQPPSQYQTQGRSHNIMMINQKHLPVMAWNVYFDQRQNLFVMYPESTQQQQYSSRLNQAHYNQGYQNNLNPHELSINQSAINKVPIITATPLVNPPSLPPLAHSPYNSPNPELPALKIAQLRGPNSLYGSQRSSETDINQINTIRSRFNGYEGVQQPEIIQYHDNIHSNLNQRDTIQYQSNRNSQVIQDDFTPKEIGAMIFNLNSNGLQPEQQYHSIQRDHPQSQAAFNTTFQSSNIQVNGNTFGTSNITQPYPPFVPQTPQTNFSSSQTIHKKVLTTDQGTSPLEDYFPVQRRATSPLRRVKLNDMEIQLSPGKPNLDKFPTVLNPRFSTSHNANPQPESMSYSYSTQYNVIPPEVQAPSNFGIVTNMDYRSRNIGSFDSPSQTKRISMLTSEPTLPRVFPSVQPTLGEQIRYQSPGRIIENKLFSNKDFEMRVENGITVYSRRSNRLIPEDSRARSLTFSPNEQHQITFESPDMDRHLAQVEDLKYSKKNDIVVDVRRSFYSPETRVLSTTNHNLDLNRGSRVSRQRQDVIVDLRTNLSPTHLMPNTLRTLEVKTHARERGTFSPRGSGAGETYINSLMSTAKPSHTYGHKLLRTSITQEPPLLPHVSNPSFLNVLYPSDETQIQTALQKRVKKINHLRYGNKESLFRLLRECQGECILIATIPYDRNVEELKQINPLARVLVFKGNPNLVKVDHRTSIANSYAQILAEIEKKVYRK